MSLWSSLLLLFSESSLLLKYSERHSQQWARLEERGTKPMGEMQRAAENKNQNDTSGGGHPADAAEHKEDASSYYVHDYSLSLAAPDLLRDSFTVPNYFSLDLRQRALKPGSIQRDSWPSLLGRIFTSMEYAFFEAQDGQQRGQRGQQRETRRSVR